MGNKIIQSYVYYEDKAFFVSTIRRKYDTYEGEVNGIETIVWEWDATTRETGEILHMAEGYYAHFDICKRLMDTGKWDEK